MTTLSHAELIQEYQKIADTGICQKINGTLEKYEDDKDFKCDAILKNARETAGELKTLFE